MTRRPCLWILAALLLAPARAWADPIAFVSIPIDFTVGSATPDEDAGVFMLRVSSAKLFNDRVITPADVGRTIVADASNDPDFPVFADRTTNGRPNFTEIMFGPTAGGGGGIGAAGEFGLFGLAPGIVDFHGFTVTSVALRVDAFSSTPSAEHASFTELRLRGSLAVLGSGAFDPTVTPEPASLVLFASGAIVAGCLRRRTTRRCA